MSLHAYELKVMCALMELEGHATFGNLAAYLNIEADMRLCMARYLPQWLKRMLLSRPRGNLKLDVALANLEDMGCTYTTDTKISDVLMMTSHEFKAGRRFRLSPQGRALLYENL